ncbi:hypothetical protein M433DRAFT_74713 [Acidomyces richmondensis BFW]|nr:MAG: hypothetical protein FE78DRAFT_139263 [Acidomyces sp. 'richmondensis']KYG41999.1 hypothetical protein M433DRAFT_74713 [Acidomyces richmondensis BFW]
MGAVQTPISAVSSRSGSTPRKTLTDQDRRRMCQYAEEHPNSKQTEIGAIFGVERSTVSKVLRQKEKYLAHDEGSKSPVKRAKGRSPDIERALAVWAKNQEKKGMPLTDEIIRDKARAFAATTTSPDNHTVLSSSWIEKFKLKNNLMGARSRKGSLAPDDAEGISAATSSSHTPNGVSPVSPPAPGSPSPIDLHSAKSQESLKNESPDSFLDYTRRTGPFHSQSATSLNSAFTDTAPSSSFSPGPLSPTPSLFTPDSGTAPSPFIPAQIATARPILPAPANSNQQRPRSQTFPLLDQYMAVNSSTDVVTPKFVSESVLDSPMEEATDPLSGIDETMHVSHSNDKLHTVAPAETMRPPPLPAHVLNAEGMREVTPSRSNPSLKPMTSPEEALQALEVVHSFFEQQPNGFLDFQESVTMGKLMEKLKLQSRSGSISG